MPSIIATQQQWPRGPANELHGAAYHGCTEKTTALLSKGLINIDEGDPSGWTPLIVASNRGFSPAVQVLLDGGANISIASDGGFTALHHAAQGGHLAVTTDLVTAGADLDATTDSGATPLHLAVINRYQQVVTALIEAGVDVDSHRKDFPTPLFFAAGLGYIDIARELLLGSANALLTPLSASTVLPLNAAALSGHSKVVCELIKQRGIAGCAGPSGGVDALCEAAVTQQVEVMALLMDAGVMDTGAALVNAARWGGEVATKFLLQQRQFLQGSPTGLAEYVNFCGDTGLTALLASVACGFDASGKPQLLSPRVVRLLMDAGADTRLGSRIPNGGGSSDYVTPLGRTNDNLRSKCVAAKPATEEQLHRLEAIRRLLMRVEAVHAQSWLWHTDVVSNARAVGNASKTPRTTPASSHQLTLMLPILRRRRRGALLAPVLRCGFQERFKESGLNIFTVL